MHACMHEQPPNEQKIITSELVCVPVIYWLFDISKSAPREIRTSSPQGLELGNTLGKLKVRHLAFVIVDVVEST